MGSNFRWLINVGLLVLPIAVTLGVLLGLQKHRDDTGQPPLFSPPPIPGPGGGDQPKNNSISENQYCQKAFGIHPLTDGLQYTLNPNQWGWDEGDPGFLCMNVTTFNNQTYPTKYTAPEFSVTWQYPPGPESAPVHAFPNIKVDDDTLPTTLDTIKSINVDMHWTYGVGNATSSATDVDSLKSDGVNANVAIDMFLSSDKSKAGDSEKADHEVMVWFAAVGAATQPIGFDKPAVTTQTLDGSTFSLYVGMNGPLRVLTWYSEDPVENFTGDISPFLESLTQMDETDYPRSTDYLGYLSMGTEAYSSTDSVTFYCPKLSIDIETNNA